jgi:hypothetical protein
MGYSKRPHQKKNNFFNRSWHLKPCRGLEIQKPIEALRSVKGLDNTYDISPKWARTLQSDIFHGIFKEAPPNIYVFNRSWYVTPSCGLEVQKSIQTRKTVKDLGNTFDLTQSGQELWRLKFSIGYLKRPPNIFFVLIEVEICHPAEGLRYKNPPKHLNELKAWAII